MKINRKKQKKQRRQRAQPAAVTLGDTADTKGRSVPGYKTKDGQEVIAYRERKSKHSSRNKYAPGGGSNVSPDNSILQVLE